MWRRRDYAQSSFLRTTLWDHLFAPVDIASLVFFRIAFGAIMLWGFSRYFHFGNIQSLYIEPSFHFTFYGFSWVRPWPAYGMYIHFVALATFVVFIMLGTWYRVSTTLFFFGFTYVFLLDQAYYLNHYYLICLVSLLLIFIPAHRAFSIDSLRFPDLRTATAPAWALWLLRAQIGIVYFYAGLAKLNFDWLRGEPMRARLATRTDFPIIGPLFTEEWMVYVFSYGGLLLDLFIVPFLLWRRTRLVAFACAVVFHVCNWQLFNIGVFPWFMIAATTLFFCPEWPRRIGDWLRRKPCETRETAASPPRARPQAAAAWLMGVYLVVQLLMPLRHHLYPGNVAWTEEGHRFAWRMRLRKKQATARFFVTDRLSKQTWEFNPASCLTELQLEKMPSRPDMILQLSHKIANDLRLKGYEQVEVRARVCASMHQRQPQLLIDPTVDLSTEPRTLLAADWILPREQ